MNGAVIGGTIGLILLFIAIGLVAGLVRGLKRASVHVIFVLVSILVAFFITKPITNAVLNGITVVSGGETVSLQQLIVGQVYKLVDLSAYTNANAFLNALPTAIASPFVFIIMTLAVFLIFDIIYLIVARIAFGKKKVDFKDHKPRRWYGAAIGAVECFIFLLVLCAPLTALTKTYQQLALVGPQLVTSETVGQESYDNSENFENLENFEIVETFQNSKILQSQNGEVLQTQNKELSQSQNKKSSQSQNLEILQNQNVENSHAQKAEVLQEENESTQKFQLKPLPQLLEDFLPQSISKPLNSFVTSYNKTILAKMLGSGANGGGIDKMFFDGLANMKIAGVKINLRKELLCLADVYNEVAVAYSAFDAKQFDQLNIHGLTTQVEGFVNRGLFRAVLADTAQQYLKTFDADKVELPQILEDILSALKDKLQQEDASGEQFDFYQFLKGDIFKLTETAEKLFEKTADGTGEQKSLIADLVELFENKADNPNQDKNQIIDKVLKVIEKHSQKVKTIAKDVMTMQTIKVAFQPVVNFASQKVQDFFKNEEGEVDQNIKLNAQIEDWDGFVDNLVLAVENFVKLSDECNLDISAILSGEDLFKTIANLQNISNSLGLLGTTLDQVRNLEILKFEKDTSQEQSEKEYDYVLDAILSRYNLVLLGDQIEDEQGQPTTISSFTQFFEYISTPIEKLKELGILNALSSETVDAKSLIASIVDAVSGKNNAQEEKPQLISQALMPLYQLQKAQFAKDKSVKEMVFGLLTDNLQSVEILNFAALKNDETHQSNDTYERWKKELENLGKALCALSGGEIVDESESGGGKTYTYLNYFLEVEQPDMEKLLSTILDKSQLGPESEFRKVLSPIFEGEIFSPIVKMIYDNLDAAITEIDSQIENLTGENPSTSFSAWAQGPQGQGRADIVADLEAVLKDVYNTNFSYDESSGTKEAFQFVGQLLDTIKSSAFNNGAKDGLLKNEFQTLVWYLTGADMTGEGDGKLDNPPTDSSAQEYLQALREEIKEKCNVSTVDDYYTVNFSEAISQAIEALAAQFPLI